jgi:hypothetical protein
VHQRRYQIIPQIVLPAGALIWILVVCLLTSSEARTSTLSGSTAAAPMTTPTAAPATAAPAWIDPVTGLPATAPPMTGPPATGFPITEPQVTGTPVIGAPTTAAATIPSTNGATPAPTWLGTQVLPTAPNGYGVVKATPPELRNRRIITKDVLQPPIGGLWQSSVTTVPADVAQRSTWSAKCPVKLSDLRYVTVSFAGFDGWAHTGELLVNRKVADDVVTVFGKLFAARWPIEQMVITSPAELAAPSTGDGNNTSAFVCRPVRGSTKWSQHAYGLAIDVNPFHNPYVKGKTLLPELSRFYKNRTRGLPGMNTPGSEPVVAFQSIGWGWGGNFTAKKDWMHFSSTGK